MPIAEYIRNYLQKNSFVESTLDYLIFSNEKSIWKFKFLFDNELKNFRIQEFLRIFPLPKIALISAFNCPIIIFSKKKGFQILNLETFF